MSVVVRNIIFADTGERSESITFVFFLYFTMRPTTALTFLALLLFFSTGCGRLGISSAPVVSSTSIGINQMVTGSAGTAVMSSPPTTTLVSPIKGWKVYVDDTYHFSFSYPAGWSVQGDGNKVIKNEEGKMVIFVSTGGRHLGYEQENTLEKYIKSVAGEDVGVLKVENILFEKIVDTTTTLGYLSQWQVFYQKRPFPQKVETVVLDKPVIEIRADFEAKTEQPYFSGISDWKTVINFKVEHETLKRNLVSLLLFQRIVSTFQFNQ